MALAQQYLAMAQFFNQQHDQALESALQAVTLDPKNYYSRYLRAFLATSGSGMMSSNAQVEQDLRQAIALNPDFSPPYALLAVYLAATNRNLDEALALAQKAVSFEPGNSNYQLSLAQVLLRMNKFDEANLATARASAWARDPAERENAESVKSYVRQVRQFQNQMKAANTGQPETAGDDLSEDNPAQNEALGAEPHPGASSGSKGVHATTLHLQVNITPLGNPSGMDLTPYLQEVIGKLRDQLLSPDVPVSLSQPRIVSLEFAILKDGTVANLRVSSSSGDATLDQHTRDVLAASSPLPALPGEFTEKSLQLRLKLSYSQESSVPQ